VAVDTETMGLITTRDRLCLLQISDGMGDEHLVRFAAGTDYAAPNLRAVLADPARLKLYHFARFDLAAIHHYLGVMAAPCSARRSPRSWCARTPIATASRNWCANCWARSSKQQQSSDWGAPVLSDAQQDYAASDVRFLHAMHTILEGRLAREGRTAMAKACFEFLPTGPCWILPAGPIVTFQPRVSVPR